MVSSHVLKLARPLFADRFYLPTQKDIDPRIVAGPAIFGIGWGLAGFCPGPALTALGFRVRQAVTIRAGTIARVPITPPMGRLSINAQPWAQVLIDDTAVGETPLANVPATLGEHQITFRHPQFGERRERVIVRADAPARVSTTFQR